MPADQSKTQPGPAELGGGEPSGGLNTHKSIFGFAGNAAGEQNMSDRVESLLEALIHIKEWCDAYPEDVFLPVKPDMADARAALEAAGVSMDALHAHWARHLLGGIGKIASNALSPAP